MSCGNDDSYERVIRALTKSKPMDRRDFVRSSGAAVALLTGCLGGSSNGDGGGTNTTEDGGAQNQTETDGAETDGEDSGTDEEAEENGEEETEEDEPEVGDTGYREFMYDPEQAGVDAEGYVFSYTGSEASEELASRIHGATDSTSVRTARIEIRSTDSEGELPEQDGGDTVYIRVYEDESSYGELSGRLTEPVDSRAGYEIYESGGTVFGINESALTVVEGPTTDRVRLVAETLSGETESYAENDDISVLTDAVGTGDAVLVRGSLPELPESDIPGIETAIASAVSLTEEDGTVALRYAVVYPDGEGANAAVSTESLEDVIPEDENVPSDEPTPLFVLAATELAVRPEDLEVSDQRADGRVAVLEGSTELDAL